MKHLVSGLLLFFLPSLLWAQSISGTLMDQRQQLIDAAYIYNTSNDEHTHSDAKGLYSMEVSQGDSLYISHISFHSKYLVVQSTEQSFDVTLVRKTISLDEIVIAPEIDALTIFSKIDLQVNPVNSSQDILRQVPGLFIGQHAGGGKAEQIFLRGFDIDHGTDINITVDDMAVNMVSHAHGQGYSDLHFIIPETVDKIDFGKGSYDADKGNFATAGFVAFKTKEKLNASEIKIEAGQFNSKRILGMFNLSNDDKTSAYVATEYITMDGPFDSPQNFNRLNIMGKATHTRSNQDKVSLTASTFSSRWDASGQVPQRAVNSGLIGRFGAIDDTEGGQTSRTNVLLNYRKHLTEQSYVKNSVYYTNYNFELFSNFTFFLNDPINGDQIKQKENRNLIGINSEYNGLLTIGNNTGKLQAGVNLRTDQSQNNELAHTANRTQTIYQTQLGEINESNFGAYASIAFTFDKWMINPGVRFDYLHFQYNDELLTTYRTQSTTGTIVSPKLNILYNYSRNLQLYVKAGKGFHSNDTRVSVAKPTNEVLPASYNADVGFIWKPTSNVVINAAYWNLFLEQEFVYVGDEGVVEPSGKTTRQGFDLSVRYQPLDWMYWNVDANYTYARSIEAPQGQNFIPLAPDFTLVSGINVVHPNGIHGGINARHLGDRPANENKSIIAEGYTVVDANLGYKWKNIDFGVQVENVFDTEWNETQFATETRLSNETSPVEEIHFTPGVPLFVRGSISFKF